MQRIGEFVTSVSFPKRLSRSILMRSPIEYVFLPWIITHAFVALTLLVDMQLMKKLQSVNEKLKKFAHVNKKAFEQYNNFTKQRDQLIQRREELDKSAKSIEELVEVLDQRKDEAIERTFKQVASNFAEVFDKLVPAGRGRLIIQRRIDQDEDEVEEAEETQQSSVDNYTGVSIKVRRCAFC